MRSALLRFLVAVRAGSTRLGASLDAERDHWALWLPVFMGGGIALYFALGEEPRWWLGVAALAAPAVVLAVGWRRLPARAPRALATLLAVAMAALGFTLAQGRTVLVAAPMLDKRLGPTHVTGRVVLAEVLADGQRLVVDRPRVSGLGPERTPERVRLRLRRALPDAAPGDWVRVRAVLLPPPAPAAPGAFDFQRQSFFEGVGAVGYSVGAAEVVAKAGDGDPTSPRLLLAALRQAVTARILAGVEGSPGAVAAALMTGERATISEPVMDAIRDSGLAHLLAISGLHIGLVAGILFVGLRGLLALVPALALRHPIKKWAAVLALPGALAYTLLAGATVPSQRSFIMIGLVLIAVLADRRGISLRLIAWAAVAVLALQPESLLGASFQMSFAAVIALVAGYEAWQRRRARVAAPPPGLVGGVGRYLGGVLLTTLIAGLATAPFALYHFNRYAVFGLAANLVAVPVTALWIMPLAVVAFLLMPLGLEGAPLVAVGWGTAAVIAVAEEVAGWPGAVARLPAMPGWGLAAVALGGLWLCLWRTRWRLWGMAGIAAGMASVLVTVPPDVLVDGAGRLIAVRAADGGLLVSSARAARFEREAWLRQSGDDEEGADPWPRQGATADGRLACDSLGCLYRVGGLNVALARDPAALDDDCRLAQVVVSLVPAPRGCRAPAAVIDRFDLWRDGGHALWLTGERVRVLSVNAWRGNRPWVVRPRPP